MNYDYTNLSSALDDKASPLRQLLDERLPNSRPVQASFRDEAGSIRVDGGSANPGTIGTAFDVLTRFRLDSMHNADASRTAFRGRSELIAEIDAVVIAAQVAGAIGDRDGLAKASWALALLEEVYRARRLWPGSPLSDLLETGRCTAQALLELAPADALRQLKELDAVADAELKPNLVGPLHVGPTFDGSKLCAADADLIANDLVVDIKTNLGLKNPRTGERADRLDRTDLLQVVSYALFDRSDSFQIRRVGLYSARYGHLAIWDLGALLDTLAGGQVVLEVLREDVWLALGGDGIK